MASKQGEAGYRVVLRGVVQGVGFRPFVYHEAKRFGIRGMVCNHDGGVMILASGSGFSDFFDSIKENNPSGSWIESVTVEPWFGLFEAEGFIVAESLGGGLDESRFFPPDMALCERCQAEIFDKSDRRAGHYFNNCIACGPRFSALKAFPYDRANTTMSAFPLCGNCFDEYNTSDDPRFHAETVCCRDCGPVLHYRRSNELYCGDEVFTEAMRDLSGGIAIKGIGGYHLACCPYDERAVRHLRRLKLRESKPFALMFRDIADIFQICEISSKEEELLTSPARPIVLLKMKHNPFAWELLRGVDGRCGCFLPYTPLQALLLADRHCLVMTSANLSSCPMIKDENEIFTLTDRVLYHDREIIRGIEDSVMQTALGKPCFIRRGRGFTPLPVTIENPDNIQLFATGGDIKASFGMLKRQAFIQSQPLGDLENDLTFKQFERSIADFESLFAIKPEAVVCDAHPRYFSSVPAKQMSESLHIPLIQVQHHHAHIASVMAEHRLSRVLGVAMDGAGYGDDGNIWGGEFLICEGGDYSRAGHLAYTKVVGADTAAVDAARTAECYLQEHGLPSFHSDPTVIEAALEHNIGTFLTSGMGRLFDVVSALLGICSTNSYEGECAMRLQYKAEEEERAKVPPLDMHFDIKTEKGMHICHFSDILQKCRTKALGAALGFHNAVCGMITEMCVRICANEDIVDIALSGGVFQNSLLLEKVATALTASGFNVFINELVPPNDEGLALGQAFVGVMSLRSGDQWPPAGERGSPLRM